MAKRIKKNYVNNNDLLEALIEYKKEYRETLRLGIQKPKVSNYIGECIFSIATNLSKKPNFYSYTFREDMIMDGVENCLAYIHNFDENKTTRNPFAYITQIVYYAFLRKIAKEKKQMYIKFKNSQELVSMSDTYEGGDEIPLYLNSGVEYMNAFIEDYEDKMNRSKKAPEDELSEDPIPDDDTIQG